jgi:hypothetical protein
LTLRLEVRGNCKFWGDFIVLARYDVKHLMYAVSFNSHNILLRYFFILEMDILGLRTLAMVLKTLIFQLVETELMPS